MILSIYFAKRFVWTLLSVIFGLFVLYFFIELQTHLGRFSDSEISIGRIVGITLIGIPESIYEILPLAVAFAALGMSVRLAATSELVVTRSAGVSALATLMVPTAVATAIGILAVIFINPIIANLSKQHDYLVNFHTESGMGVRFTDGDSIWLRQSNDFEHVVIHASVVDLGTSFKDASFFIFNDAGFPRRRIFAESATIEDGNWQLKNLKIWQITPNFPDPESTAISKKEFAIPTDFTNEQIQERHDLPEQVSFWDLPKMIQRIDNSGFSSLSHRVYFQMEIAKPILFAAMTLIGAGFTLQPSRFNHVGLMAVAAVISGIGVFYLKEFSRTLGEVGQIPVVAAAWIPPTVALLFAFALLVYVEEG